MTLVYHNFTLEFLLLDHKDYTTGINTSRNKIAVLVPTHNSPACVASLVRYYRSIDFTGKVYFGGDKNSFGDTNQFNFTPQERVRYRFIDCGAKDTLDALYQIASEALRSKIEYCTYHGDDDFLTSEGLDECGIG